VDVVLATAVFGPAVGGARASYRYGLTETLELSAAPSVMWVAGAGAGDSHAGIYAFRAGAKYAPVRHISATFGLGGGGSAAGGFLSPDYGLNLGWDNRYLVPFAAARMFLSAPLAARYVHFTSDDDSWDDPHDPHDAPDHNRRRPHFTYGFQVSGGLRAPLYWRPDARFRPALTCAVGAVFLYDSSQHGGFMGVGCGLDLGF
jgi:hypothetical protein